jgi:uncharacterized protein YceK
MMDYSNPNEMWRRTGFDPYKWANDKERAQLGCMHGILFLLAAAILIAVMALCQGCTTVREVIVTQQHTDTVYQNRMQHDSIHIRDSIWVERWTQGDTVYVVKDRWKTEWREKLRVDTVYIAKHDTVRVAVTQQQTRQLTWFERWRERLGTILFIAMGLFAIYCGWSFIKNVRNKLP